MKKTATRSEEGKTLNGEDFEATKEDFVGQK